MKTKKWLQRSLLTACLAGLFASSGQLSIADDIDSYRAPPKQKISHNMLFILDQSTSMNSTAGATSRMNALKQSLTRVLGLPDMQGNNVAIMGYSTSGGAWLNPLGDFAVLNTATITTLRNRVNALNTIQGTASAPALYYGLKWMSSGWNSMNPAPNSPPYNLSRNSGMLNSPMNAANHCADNRIIFLSDGAPNTGIRNGNRISLDVTPTDPANALNLLRMRERGYVTNIYGPSYNIHNGLFNSNFGPSAGLLLGGGAEGVHTNRFRTFLFEANNLTGANRTTLLTDIATRSATRGVCNPYTDLPFTYNWPNQGGTAYHNDARWARRPAICLAELASFASNSDFRTASDFPNTPRTQTITIDTIGFGMTAGSVEDQFMNQLATVYGGGRYYPVTNQNDLDAAFQNIASNVSNSVKFAYNSPSIPVDLSDPTAVGSSLYLPLLEPSNTKIWPGNLNKYKYTLTVSTFTTTVSNAGTPVVVVKQKEDLQITGKGDRVAFSSTGTLNPNTYDLWSVNDSGGNGNNIKTGGVASLLHANTNRKIYTQDSSKASNLGLITESAPPSINKSDQYTVRLNGNYLFCWYYYCPLRPNQKGIYRARVTDKNLSTSTAIGNLDSKPYATWWSIDLGKNSGPRIYPDKIKVHIEPGIANTPSSFTFTLWDRNSVQKRPSATLVDNVYTIEIPENTSGQNYDLSWLDIKCAADCSVNRQLPVAEVEIYERPLGASISDEQWFTTVPLTSAQISNSVTKIGAPFHTRPTAVTIDGHTTIYQPTSEGVMHAFDAQTGQELWGFMPKTLLSNIAVLRNNSTLEADENPIYGLDGQPYYFTIKDSASVKHILVFGMRRGGQNYYALDITNRNSPKLLWQIGPNQPAFANLGQTWAEPYPAPITINGNKKKALVFGGGYDSNSDAKVSHTNASGQRVPDKVGNRIYFVDAYSGELLAVVTDDNTATTENFGSAQKIVLPGLDFGIVAQPIHADYDQDDEYDRFYFADTGGQIIRVDMTDATSGPSVKAKIMANLGGSGEEGFIRFFNQPSLSRVVLGGLDTLSIVLGSGNRPQLGQKGTIDKLFVIRDRAPYSQDFTQSITTNDLFDTTSNVLQMSNDTSTLTANAALLSNADGWYLKLGENNTSAPYSGEKVINRARVYKGVVYFSTYTLLSQGSNADVCNYVESRSRSRFYAINLANGSAVYPEFHDDGDGGANPVTRDRFVTLENAGGGIPSEISFYTVRGDRPDSTDIIVSSGIGGGPRVELNDTLTAKSWEVLQQ